VGVRDGSPPCGKGKRNRRTEGSQKQVRKGTPDRCDIRADARETDTPRRIRTWNGQTAGKAADAASRETGELVRRKNHGRTCTWSWISHRGPGIDASSILVLTGRRWRKVVHGGTLRVETAVACVVGKVQAKP